MPLSFGRSCPAASRKRCRQRKVVLTPSPHWPADSRAVGGDDTLDGGAGDDVFRIAPGYGSDTITDFGTGANRLEFTEGLFANLEAVQASAAEVGDDLLIRLSATETLTLAGASVDDLSTDTVTTLNAEGADTTTDPAPFYFFFEYDEDEEGFLPTGVQNVGNEEGEDLVASLEGNGLLRGFSPSASDMSNVSQRSLR